MIKSGSLPSDLSEAMDPVRIIGNLAAHPFKNKRTGEVVDVESGEAEWLLDTLEELFDYYFVRPARLKNKQATLRNKLQEANRTPKKEEN